MCVRVRASVSSCLLWYQALRGGDDGLWLCLCVCARVSVCKRAIMSFFGTALRGDTDSLRLCLCVCTRVCVGVCVCARAWKRVCVMGVGVRMCAPCRHMYEQSIGCNA